MHKFSETLFLKSPFVGILRGYTEEEVLNIVAVYLQEGFSNIEITMNTPNVISIIRALVDKYPKQLNVGAGTVLSTKEVDQVLLAGGQFIVSPIVDIAVIEYCKNKDIPIFPGAYSPTEIHQAWKAGARMVKVFPARNLGPNYIKDVLAPLDNLELMPTGGVGLNNIQPYLAAGAKAFGMGGNLFDKNLIKNKDWNGLAAHFRQFKELV